MNIWVVEDSDSFGWYPIQFYTTRAAARNYKREYGKDFYRVRKYVRVEESH